MKKKVVKGYLDRIENKIAVLYMGNKEEYKIDIPLKFLPKGIKENTRLNITFEIENEDSIANEIEDLRNNLLNNS
ncbi:MAG: hypothetical protein KatS3mg068_2422 [Candidatus Sericytochromatia bacterium]|nr:MAG: hypothetical protein KatS3mg068_2422 [Candidatus Sericytochromatia bacterium]